MPALVDTGSPITVLNSAAASACAISSVSTKDSTQAGPAAGLPPALKTLSRVAASLKTSLEGAQAEARGDVLRMAGGDGRMMTLERKGPARMMLESKGQAQSDEDRVPKVDLGNQMCYVGDLPGLAALHGLGAGLCVGGSRVQGPGWRVGGCGVAG